LCWRKRTSRRKEEEKEKEEDEERSMHCIKETKDPT